MPSQSAITASDVRDALENATGYNLPASLTDAIIEGSIQRRTARVLEKRGLTTLPSADSVERDFVDGVVLDLVVIDVKKWVRGDDPEMMKALVLEEKQLIQEAVREVKESSSGNVRFTVIGGSGSD